MFAGLFVALFFFMGFHRLWYKEPQSIHAWRQADSYAIAFTYYMENHPLLEPHFLYTAPNGDRQAVSEFPIIYWVVAKIWKITGESPGLFRLVNLLILWVGLFHLYRLIDSLLTDRFWSLAIVLFVYSSPLIGYYSFNFTPDVPALGLAMSGLYFVCRYLQTGRATLLVAATLFYVLAALLRVTALFSLLAVGAALLVHFRSRIREHRARLIPLSISFVVVVGTYLVWNRYAHWYNQHHIPTLFLQKAQPVWELDSRQISRITRQAYEMLLPMYFNRPALLLVGGIFGLVVLHRKTVEPVLFGFCLFFGLGVVAFLVLFFRAFDVHDYFLTFTLLLIPAVLTGGLLALKQTGWPGSPAAKVPAALLVALLLNSGMVISRSHYNPRQQAVCENIPEKKSRREYWEYVYWTMELQDFQYRGMAPYMRQIGVRYADKVISLGDYSPNRTLVWMETQGFTEVERLGRSLPQFVGDCIAAGAKYLVYNENDKPDLDALKPYLGKPIGQYNIVHVFEIGR